MSKRAGQPKPSASERTWRRFRIRKDIPTRGDEAHVREQNTIKERIMEWFGRKPEPEIEAPVMAGSR